MTFVILQRRRPPTLGEKNFVGRGTGAEEGLFYFLVELNFIHYTFWMVLCDRENFRAFFF